MNDRSHIDLVVTVDDLIHEGYSLSFRKRSLAADDLGKVASITEFSNNVCVVPCVVDVIDFYDVIAILEVFEDINLRS